MKEVPRFASLFNAQAVPALEPGDGSKKLAKLKRKRRRNAFGRADLADTYRKANDLIIEYKIFRLSQYAEIDGVRQLTICNIWRIERLPDDSVRTLELCLRTGVWTEASLKLTHWPIIPFYPIKKTKSLEWWRSIVQEAIWKALYAAGYSDLPDLNESIDWEEGENGRMKMSRKKMANLLIARYLGQHRGWNAEDKSREWTRGYLDPNTMKAGARALRAAFYNHILDHAVLSAMLAINYRDCSFLRYLDYARQRTGLLKVSTEHRNLLPLLPGVNPEQWQRDDLFSRKLWVKDGRKSTALDRRPVRIGKEQDCFELHSVGQAAYRSFDVPAAWRWLSKASSVIVREWEGSRDNIVITNLALANISVKAPVYAYVQIIRAGRRLNRYGVSPSIQQFFRIFFSHCAKMWKEEGYAKVRVWLRDKAYNDISVLLDYLDGEGFEQGIPNKQSTWAALLRRSDDWHQRVAIERMEKKLQGKEILKWKSLLPEMSIDGIVFTPLTDSRALAIEGYELHHCVGQYDLRCYQGKYRVFSVKEPDETRSTLGFEISGRKTIWDQHMSKYNGPISREANQAGLQLIARYQLAL
jgi:hypothetical protein